MAVAPLSAPSGLKVATLFTKLLRGFPSTSVLSGPTTTRPSSRSVTKA